MSFKIEVINNEFINYNKDNHFGHKFTIRLTSGEYDFTDCNLRWYERTNKPYIDNQTEGEWIDLVDAIGEGSDVFVNWFNRDNTLNTIDLIDPPGINCCNEGKTNSRILEFYIVFSNEDGEAVWLRLQQELKCEGNSIICQKMEILEEGSGENPMYPPEV